jgi:outer membrane protein insertion porin family
MPSSLRLAIAAAVALVALPALRADAQAPAEDAVPGPPPEREQRHYVVERVVLNGLAHTNPAEVRRRILVEEGDVLDDDDVLLSRLRLLQLGWFARVETRVERGSERGKVLLVFDLTERNTLLVSDLVFGSTEPQPFYAGLGLSQQNFLGRGLGLSGAFAYGGSPHGRPADPARFALRGAFFAPDLEIPGLPPIVLGLSGLWLRGEELACATPDCDAYDDAFGDAPRTRYRRAGGEVTIGFRPGPFERLLAGYRVEAVRSEELAGTRGADGRRPFLVPGRSLVSAVTGAWELDTRDDFFFPTEGWRSLFQLTFASRLLGGDYEYSRYSLQVESAYALFGLPLRAQAMIGAVQGAAPFFDRFYAADHAYFAVGPALGRALELNFSTDSRYDAFLATLGLEYAIPLWSEGAFFQRGYLALGARGLYSSDELGGSRTAVSDLPVSFDVALRFDTPVGTFNASIGYALDNVL